MSLVREAMIERGLYDTPIIDINNREVLNEFLGNFGGEAVDALIGGASDLISRSIAEWFLEYLGINTQSLFGNLIVEVFENAPVLRYWMGDAECDDLADGIAQAIGETFTEPIGMGILQHLGLDMQNVFGRLFYESVQNNFMDNITDPMAHSIQSVICVITWRDAAGIATNGVFGTNPNEVKRKIEAAADEQAVWRQQGPQSGSDGNDGGNRETALPGGQVKSDQINIDDLDIDDID